MSVWLAVVLFIITGMTFMLAIKFVQDSMIAVALVFLALAGVESFAGNTALRNSLDQEKIRTIVDLRSDIDVVGFGLDGLVVLSLGDCNAKFYFNSNLRSADGRLWPIKPGTGRIVGPGFCPAELDKFFAPTS